MNPAPLPNPGSKSQDPQSSPPIEHSEQSPEPESNEETPAEKGSVSSAIIESSPIASNREVAADPVNSIPGGDEPQPAESAVPAAPLPDELPQQSITEREDSGAAVLARSRAQTRRAFLTAAAGVFAGFGLYEFLERGPQAGMQPYLLRKALNFNAALSRVVFHEHALAPTYPLGRAKNIRVNGVYGLKQALVPESWRLQLVGVSVAAGHPRFTQDVTAWEYSYTGTGPAEDKGHDTKIDPSFATSVKMAPQSAMQKASDDEGRAGRRPRGVEEAGQSRSTLPPHTPGLLLTMQDILSLPRHELVTQFKCIEGWSQVVHWAGVRVRDFMEAYPPAPIDGKPPKYVYMETPDGDYYTGYDLQALQHPQALLVTEMMGAPLTQYHGAPLRLHMPTKYGYKQIKRIALFAYTNEQPDDYWTKLGYDWYAGL